MKSQRQASNSAFERGDRVKAGQLRQQGQFLQHMTEQVVGARRGINSKRDVAQHLDNIRRIYDDLTELRLRIEGKV